MISDRRLYKRRAPVAVTRNTKTSRAFFFTAPGDGITEKYTGREQLVARGSRTVC